MRKLLALWFLMLFAAGLVLTGTLQGKSGDYAVGAARVVADGLTTFERYMKRRL